MNTHIWSLSQHYFHHFRNLECTHWPSHPSRVSDGVGHICWETKPAAPLLRDWIRILLSTMWMNPVIGWSLDPLLIFVEDRYGCYWFSNWKLNGYEGTTITHEILWHLRSQNTISMFFSTRGDQGTSMDYYGLAYQWSITTNIENTPLPTGCMYRWWQWQISTVTKQTSTEVQNVFLNTNCL